MMPEEKKIEEQFKDGYYWVQDHQEPPCEWSIVLYDSVFNEFYRIGSLEALGEEEVQDCELIYIGKEPR